MNEKCACRKVEYMPITNEDGSYIEQWMCLECKSIFVRQPAAPDMAERISKLEAQNARMTEMLLVIAIMNEDTSEKIIKLLKKHGVVIPSLDRPIKEVLHD